MHYGDCSCMYAFVFSNFSVIKKVNNDKGRINKTIGMDGRVTQDESAGNRFDGLLLSIEEGRTLGGLRNVEATEILRRNECANNKEQERELVKYAKERGCWFCLHDIKKYWHPLPHPGAESVVYSDSCGKHVLKVMSYFMNDTPICLIFAGSNIPLFIKREICLNKTHK